MLLRQVPTFRLPAEEGGGKEGSGIASGNYGHGVCIFLGAHTVRQIIYFYFHVFVFSSYVSLVYYYCFLD